MLLTNLQEDLKQAQLNRDELKVSTLRLVISEIKNAQISKGVDLADNDIILLIQKEVKKRNESIAAFKAGNRQDLADKEQSEIEILKVYLPTQLSSEELSKMVDEAIAQTGAKAISDMGKVIGMVLGKAAGRADGSAVSTLVKEKLS